MCPNPDSLIEYPLTLELHRFELIAVNLLKLYNKSATNRTNEVRLILRLITSL